MIEDIRQISRSSTISSREQRELDDKVYGELSSQYHRILKTLGKLGTVSTCLTLTSSSLVTLLRSADPEDNEVEITSSTDAIYPTALTDEEKAEAIPEFGIMIGKRVNTKTLFTDDNGYIRPTVTITRSTDNAVFLESPDYMIENKAEHALEGEEPYLAQFVRADMTKANINLDIRSTDQPFLINSIKYTPMPMAGSVVLERLRYDGVNPVVLNGSVQYAETTLYDVQKTLPGYIHFEPIETSLIRVALGSRLYVSTLNAVSIGVSSIVGEFHTYAQTSYLGYEVPYPDGYPTLTRVTLSSDGYTGSLSNITTRIYTSVDEFNAVSSSYAVSCGTDQTVSVADPGTGKLYVLVKFESVNNTTPCLAGITLQFS